MSRQGRGTVVVTGGAGFIGSHLTTRLVQCCPAEEIVVIDKLGYCGNLNNLTACRMHSNFTFIQGDLTDYGFCQKVFLQLKPRIVFHLAARTHVDQSFSQALDFTRDNVVGTHVLLETIRLLADTGCPIERLVHCSTDEVYGEARNEECFEEDAALRPTNPYAATKASAENLIEAYKMSFQLPVIIVRSNNIYGPHQYPEKVIANWILALLPGGHGKCKVHGDGSNKRTYVYVEDFVDALVLLMTKGVIGQTYNVGSEDEYSNLQLAQMLIDQLSANESSTAGGTDPPADPQSLKDKHIEYVTDRPYNDARYGLNYNKITSLGWRRQTPWSVGISLTIDWYRRMTPAYWDHFVRTSCSEASRFRGSEIKAALQHFSTPDWSHMTAKERRDVYEPADTFLLLDALEQDQCLLRSTTPLIALEVGSGSGCVIAFLRSILGPNLLYLSTDLNSTACDVTSRTMTQNASQCISDAVQMNLLDQFRASRQLDIVLFNPPYVPVDDEEDDEQLTRADLTMISKSWAGGSDGTETTMQFLKSVFLPSSAGHSVMSDQALVYIVVLKKQSLDVIAWVHEETQGKWIGKVVLERKAGMEHLSIVRFQMTRTIVNSAVV